VNKKSKDKIEVPMLQGKLLRIEYEHLEVSIKKKIMIKKL
jgi:hypothetical protein